MHKGKYHGVAPSSTQPFIPVRSIKWAPGTLGDLIVKIKLSPRSGSVALRKLNLNHKKGPLSFFSNYLWRY